MAEITNKDVRQMVRELIELGWRCQRRGSGHYKLVSPSGHSTVFPNSPSDGRWKKNKEAELRRIKRLETAA